MTFALGKTSRARLAGVHPRLVAIVERAIVLSGQDFTVFEGLRTLARQKELVRTGASKTLASQHLRQPDGFGHAVDLVPWIGGRARWEWGPIYEIARAMRAAAEELGAGDEIRWGGVWDRRLDDLPSSAEGIKAAVIAYSARHPGPDFLDGPHFEFRAAA